MVLSAHYNAHYLDVSKTRSCVGSQIMVSKEVPVLSLNVPVITIAQIIKIFMSSAVEAELSDLYI